MGLSRRRVILKEGLLVHNVTPYHGGSNNKHVGSISSTVKNTSEAPINFGIDSETQSNTTTD